MTRARRRSKSRYLNAMRKRGYRPSKGYVYRGGRWRRVWRVSLRIAFRAAGATPLTASGPFWTWSSGGDE